jgi:hypothetical protein
MYIASRAIAVQQAGKRIFEKPEEDFREAGSKGSRK